MTVKTLLNIYIEKQCYFYLSKNTEKMYHSFNKNINHDKFDIFNWNDSWVAY